MNREGVIKIKIHREERNMKAEINMDMKAQIET
jgi:RNA-binding protein YhbY